MNCPHCATPLAEHEANRCLDAWVAEAVMGWKKKRIKGGDTVTRTYWKSEAKPYKEVWQFSPSTNIADAWEVVEKMGDTQMPKHAGPTMLHRLRQCGTRGWGVIWCSDFGYTEEVFAPTAPLAICRAALQAVISEKEEIKELQ